MSRFEHLFHGSRVDIEDGFLIPNSRGEVFASNNYDIALMKAIVSNVDLKSPGLVYSYFIDEKNPLQLRIYGMHSNTIGEKGFIYVVPKTCFEINDPKGSWQYISKNKVPILEKIEVSRADLTIPIFDEDNQKWIQ